MQSVYRIEHSIIDQRIFPFFPLVFYHSERSKIEINSTKSYQYRDLNICTEW